MITSWPRETRSVPSVSGESIAFPPGLSVIESTSMRGSAASSRAISITWRLLVRGDQPAARDHLGCDDERAGPCELFAETGSLWRRRISDISLPDLSSPHGRPAGARRRDRPDGGRGLRRDRPGLGARAPGRLRRRAAGADGRGHAGGGARRVRVAGDGEIAEHAATPEFFWVRALAIEAFYSDFVAPGVDATGAWAEIDFNTPLATRLAKDWSYLGIAMSERFDVVVVGSGAGGGVDRRRARRPRPAGCCCSSSARTRPRPTSRAGRRRRPTTSGGRSGSR